MDGRKKWKKSHRLSLAFLFLLLLKQQSRWSGWRRMYSRQTESRPKSRSNVFVRDWVSAWVSQWVSVLVLILLFLLLFHSFLSVSLIFSSFIPVQSASPRFSGPFFLLFLLIILFSFFFFVLVFLSSDSISSAPSPSCLICLCVSFSLFLPFLYVSFVASSK